MFLFEPGPHEERGMARIRKEDHARILHLVDVERRPVREIAADFGCTSANIYGILAKLRREGDKVPGGAEEAGEAAGVPALLPAEQPGLSLDAATAEPDLYPAAPVESPLPKAAPDAAWEATSPDAAPRVVAFEVPAPKAAPAERPDLRPVDKPVSKGQAAVGARLARPGMGLVMRTEDGEETMTPFRSIDDLLSAIKPILRASARSPDPVWFSLQPVDLSAVEVDAA
jgi:hypothetical protein